MTLIAIREQNHNRILRLRNTETIICKPKFEWLWEESSQPQKALAKIHINNGDYEKLREWMKNHPAIELGEKNIRQLREIGSRLHIVNYSRMPKDQLIGIIQRIETHDEN